MNVGILVESAEGLDWDGWRTTCHHAERLGFESVWVSDHLASAWSPAERSLDPWLASSVAMAETARLRLGTLVSPITFRQPALMARMAEAIDDLGPGRFVLGLGLGWNADEHARFGIAFPSVDERVRLLAEGIECVRGVLGERHIPVLIGGSGPRATLPLVARYADQWNLTTASIELYRARSQRLAELCGAIGRDPSTIRRSVAAGFLIGRDAADLRERSARLQRRVPPLAAADDPVHAAGDLGWVAGTPAEIVRTLAPMAQAGIDLAILGHYDLADVDALELLAAEVVPALA